MSNTHHSSKASTKREKPQAYEVFRALINDLHDEHGDDVAYDQEISGLLNRKAQVVDQLGLFNEKSGMQIVARKESIMDDPQPANDEIPSLAVSYTNIQDSPDYYYRLYPYYGRVTQVTMNSILATPRVGLSSITVSPRTEGDPVSVEDLEQLRAQFVEAGFLPK
jgi:hypothetical protein